MGLQYRQTSFLGPPVLNKVFFAVMLDAPAVGKAAALTEGLRIEHRHTGWVQHVSRFHITMLRVGLTDGLSSGLVAKALEAAARIDLEPFPLCFDRVGSFSANDGRYPLALRSASPTTMLSELHGGLFSELRRLGIKPAKSFTPHVTLFYPREKITTRPVDAVRWTVDEFVLINSLGSGEYRILGRFPLGGKGYG